MEKQKFKAFGQIQMIAKSLLTVCGIYLALEVISYGKMGLGMSPQVDIFKVFCMAVNVLILGVVVFFVIINNDWLIRKILPDEEPIPAENQKKWFVSSLRIGLVFCGLLLLTKSTESVVYTIKIIPSLPVWGRQVFTGMLYGDRFNSMLLFENSLKVFKTVLIAYLIIGAPHFVRWQTKRAFTQGAENE